MGRSEVVVMVRRMQTLLVVLVLSVAAVAVAAPSASAAGAYCGQVWGSNPKASGTWLSPGELVNVRAGPHGCYDRVVLDVADAGLTAWSVRYVGQVRADGSGAVVPVSGRARLEVVVGVPVMPTDSWWRPDGRIVDTSRYRTLRDVAFAGSFEGMTTFGLGVRARLPFRAFVLPGPGNGSRLVIDIGHRWCAPGVSRC
jgi:hypothetical protein